MPFGKQLQIDFGEYTTRSGLKLYIFSAVLSASRYKYVALQQKLFITLKFIKQNFLSMRNFTNVEEAQESLAYSRYVRDQCLEAQRHFSGEIELECLDKALEFCIKQGSYSMGNLRDTYQSRLHPLGG